MSIMYGDSPDGLPIYRVSDQNILPIAYTPASIVMYQYSNRILETIGEGCDGGLARRIRFERERLTNGSGIQ